MSGENLFKGIVTFMQADRNDTQLLFTVVNTFFYKKKILLICIL